MIVTSEDEKIILSQLCQAIISLDENKTLSWVNQAMELELDPCSIIQNGFCKGMEIVGEKCETGEYFFPQLIDFFQCFRCSHAVLKPALPLCAHPPANKIVMGVIEGDIHDIGKNIVKSILTSYGHRIIDLGKDVPPSVFIEAAIKEKARIICVSTSVNTTMSGMEKVLDSVRSRGLQDKIKVMVGGNTISEKYANDIGADGFASNAALALNEINSLIN